MVSSIQEIITAATTSGEVPTGWEEIFQQLTEVDVLYIQEDGSVTWASNSSDISSITNLYAEYKEVEAGEGLEPTFEEHIAAEQNRESISWGETQPLWEVTEEAVPSVLIVGTDFQKKSNLFPILEEEVTLECPTVDAVNYHYQQPTLLSRAWWENQDTTHPDWLGSHTDFAHLYSTEWFSCIEEDFKVLEEQLEAVRSSARWIFCEKTINLQNYEERYREVYPADEKSPFFTPFTIEGPLMMHGFYTSYLMQIERITEEYIKTGHQAQFRFEVVKEANPTEVSAQEVADLCNNDPQYERLVQQFGNHLPCSFNYF
ncbi:hypothetical protein FRB99_005942 [Tulasnella sp. 403]|nr:hypothetical protein FRB99_005942 [Tulasnella sp. 403]